MKNKKQWIMFCAILAGFMSNSTLAGYDTRGYASSQCNSSAFFNTIHNQCMAQCRAKYPEPWQAEDGFTHFKHCYLSCEDYLTNTSCIVGYPQQRFPNPSP